MKLYSTYGLNGDVIFKNKKWTVCRINEGSFGNMTSGDLDPASIFAASSVRGVVHTNGRLSEFFAPRECGFLVVSNTPFDYLMSAADLKEIASAASSAGMGDPLTRFSAICQENANKTLDTRTVFNAAHVKDGRLQYAHSQLNPAGPLHFREHRGSFTVSNPESNQGQATGICFSNHFEMIYVPLEEEAKAKQSIQRVLERANAPGRLAADYIVIPVIWDEPQACVRVRQLQPMTSKEMLSFFGGGKSKGNKMETLSSCLEHLARKVPFMEVGDIHYIQINTQAPESPVEIEPTDWILARSSHFEIIHSDQPAPEAVDMFVRVVDKPCDDFAAALYTLFESQKGKAINIVGLSAQKIDKLFADIKNRVNAASNA